MNTREFARLTYRLLLRLHPEAFRRRFGAEMLWIFDVSAHQGQTAYMLYDGVRSVAIQHAKFDMQEEPAAAFALEVRTSALTMARFGQATVLAATVLFAVASLVAREMPPIWRIDHAQTICLEPEGPKPVVVLETHR